MIKAHDVKIAQVLNGKSLRVKISLLIFALRSFSICPDDPIGTPRPAGRSPKRSLKRGFNAV